MPDKVPCWGSILDDLWFLEASEPGPAPRWGKECALRVGQAWVDVGTKVTVTKNVDQTVGGELHGAYVDGIEHDVGVSVEKRRLLFRAMLHVLCQPRPLFGVVAA